MKIKNLFCAGMAAIMLTSTAVQVSAVTTETPAEYNHSDNEEIENDKLYISGCYLKDTSVLLHELAIPIVESVYGVDENGNIYVKDDYLSVADGIGGDDPCSEPGYPVEVYLVENGKKRLVNTHESEWCNGEPWVRGLKPYTTYTFQLKVDYLVGTYMDKNGEEKEAHVIHWSDLINVRTCPKKTAITYSKAGKHTIRLKWKAVKCEGYKLQQYNAKKKWATVKTLPKSKTSAKLTGLKKNTKYKYRVVPYGRVADKRYPRTIMKEIKTDSYLPDYEWYYTTALFAKPSKVVTIETKK